MAHERKRDIMEEQTTNKRNFKKNLVRTTIGLVTLGVIGTGIYYSNKITRESNFKRITTETGEYDLENFISYDNLKDYSLVEVKTITKENKLFIAELKEANKISGNVYELTNIDSITHCNDIFTGKNIIEGDYTKIVNLQSIEDYLVAYDLIKAKYSKEDIETLLEKIKEDYEFTKEKTLVKE